MPARVLLPLVNARPTRSKKRFKDISELRTQLYGVLREIIAIRDGIQHPAQHSLFSPARSTFGTKHLVFRTDQLIDGIERTVRITAPEVVSALPTPLLDHDDVGAALLQGYSYTEPQEALETLRQAMQAVEYEKSAEIPFGVVHRCWILAIPAKPSIGWISSSKGSNGTSATSGIRVYQLLLEDYEAAQLHFSNMLEILPVNLPSLRSLLSVGCCSPWLFRATATRTAGGPRLCEHHLEPL